MYADRDMTGMMAVSHPLTSLHQTLVHYFAAAASMEEVHRAVLQRGYQLQARGRHGPPIVADIKAIAREAARRTSVQIDEPTWQTMLAPLEIFFC